MPRSSLKKRLLISVTSAVLLFGLLEAGLRIFNFKHRNYDNPLVIWNPEHDKELRSGMGLHASHPTQLWVPRPGARIPEEWAEKESVNQEGYRGPPIPLERTSGVLRIATLGDSSSFGHSVSLEQTYTAQLERILEEGGREVETLLGGVVGHTAIQGVHRYRELIRPYRPDVVVAAYGAVNEHHAAIDGTDRVKTEPMAEAGETGRAIPEWIRNGVRCVHLMARLVDAFRGEDHRRERILAHRERRRQVHRAGEAGRVDWKGERRVTPLEFRDTLVELHREVQADGARLILICMPRSGGVEEEMPILKQYSSAVYFVAGKLELDLIDARGAFRAAARGGTPVTELFNDAFHPTPLGHRMIAEALAEVIEAGIGSE